MEKTQSGFIGFITRGSLVKQILVGLIAGIILALVSTRAALAVSLLGDTVRRCFKSSRPGSGFDAGYGLDC